MTRKQIKELKDIDVSKGITIDKYHDEEIYTKKKLRKAKYVKRTGSPGSYKYWYKDEKGRIIEKEKPRVGIKKEVKEKEGKQKLNDYEKMTMNRFKELGKKDIDSISLGRVTLKKVREKMPNIFNYIHKDTLRHTGMMRLTDEGKKFLKDYKPSKVDIEEESLVVKKKKDTIGKIKSIIEKKQYAKVDGVSVDLQTANLISTVYDNLGESNRERYSKMPIKQMVSIAIKLREKGAIK